RRGERIAIRSEHVGADHLVAVEEGQDVPPDSLSTLDGVVHGTADVRDQVLDVLGIGLALVHAQRRDQVVDPCSSARLNAWRPAAAPASLARFSSSSAATAPTVPGAEKSAGSPVRCVARTGVSGRRTSPSSAGTGTSSPSATLRSRRSPWLPCVATNVQVPVRTRPGFSSSSDRSTWTVSPSILKNAVQTYGSAVPNSDILKQ